VLFESIMKRSCEEPRYDKKPYCGRFKAISGGEFRSCVSNTKSELV
jgi:hypothetical protein